MCANEGSQREHAVVWHRLQVWVACPRGVWILPVNHLVASIYVSRKSWQRVPDTSCRGLEAYKCNIQTIKIVSLHVIRNTVRIYTIFRSARLDTVETSAPIKVFRASRF